MFYGSKVILSHDIALCLNLCILCLLSKDHFWKGKIFSSEKIQKNIFILYDMNTRFWYVVLNTIS